MMDSVNMRKTDNTFNKETIKEEKEEKTKKDPEESKNNNDKQNTKDPDNDD